MGIYNEKNLEILIQKKKLVQQVDAQGTKFKIICFLSLQQLIEGYISEKNVRLIIEKFLIKKLREPQRKLH